MSTWIFLRGLTRESRHWGSFPAVFRARIPEAEVVALDLPGNGSLHRMRSPANVAAMAEHCRAELAAQGIRPPYRVLAMSLGAMVAVAWAERHPQEVRGCVLINTSLRPFSPFYRRLRPANYPALLRLSAFGGGAETWESAIFGMTSNLSARRVQTLAAWTAWRNEHPVSRGNALRQLWAASRYRAPARKPCARTLVLASAQDALVDPHCSRRLAQLWHADFAEHPRAGHDIPLDDGVWVVEQVRRWLLAS